jgi:hypothetical protein
VKTLGLALFAAALACLAGGVLCGHGWPIAAGCGLVILAAVADLLAWATPPPPSEVAERLLQEIGEEHDYR